MSDSHSTLGERLEAVRARVARVARDAGRPPDAVQILAVSKTFAAEDVRAAARAGQTCFGESRVQEAQSKIPAASPGAGPLRWHLIGPLQRNKAKLACQLFDVIESVDRPELAESLSRCALESGRELEVLLQVNVDEEPQKSGVRPSDAAELLARVAPLSGLRVRGLMGIPRFDPEPERMRPAFARLRQLALELRLGAPPGVELDELSMGMSSDFEVAIQEGATRVRIGSAIFGRRTT